MGKAEIIIYREEQNNTDFQIEVRVEDETVWLTQTQMAELFEATKQNISLHIRNVFKEGELDENSTVKEYLTVQSEGGRQVKRKVLYYNLDVIISVGYRVKSLRGTQFRIWANKVLKDYLLKGHAINHRIEKVENDVFQIKEKVNEIEFQVNTNLPPNEGIFFDGQIFDAWQFVSLLIKDASKSIVLIDNYVDETVLILLSKRNPGVKATVFTGNISKQLETDLKKHNKQYRPIEIKLFTKAHDRFLIIDQTTFYHIGASLKDLGKKWFAFSKIDIDPGLILNQLPKR
ncbi:MAG: virulence RhuM family protein [Bacteroidales bacterium]|nr:virulence RhuM family protein [Bacteroidales bacterium]MCF8375866.1 virulence RhuM family protein [Bacteroidales bacterium]